MRAVKKYFDLQDSTPILFSVDDSSDVDQGPVVTTHPTINETRVDRLLGHLLVNGLIPPTMMVLLTQYDPAAAAAMLTFFQDHVLGSHVRALFPALNVGLSLAVTGVEVGVRAAFDKQKKTDFLVHTPFPGITAFDRKMAAFLCFLMYGMQTANGVLAEQYAHSKTAKVMEDLYKNPLFAFYGQMLVAFLLYHLAAKVAAPMLSLWRKRAAPAEEPERQSMVINGTQWSV